jgi:hypothetical protein
MSRESQSSQSSTQEHVTNARVPKYESLNGRRGFSRLEESSYLLTELFLAGANLSFSKKKNQATTFCDKKTEQLSQGRAIGLLELHRFP